MSDSYNAKPRDDGSYLITDAKKVRVGHAKKDPASNCYEVWLDRHGLVAHVCPKDNQWRVEPEDNARWNASSLVPLTFPTVAKALVGLAILLYSRKVDAPAPSISPESDTTNDTP